MLFGIFDIDCRNISNSNSRLVWITNARTGQLTNRSSDGRLQRRLQSGTTTLKGTLVKVNWRQSRVKLYPTAWLIKHYYWSRPESLCETGPQFWADWVSLSLLNPSSSSPGPEDGPEPKNLVNWHKHTNFQHTATQCTAILQESRSFRYEIQDLTKHSFQTSYLQFVLLFLKQDLISL